MRFRLKTLLLGVAFISLVLWLVVVDASRTELSTKDLSIRVRSYRHLLGTSIRLTEEVTSFTKQTELSRYLVERGFLPHTEENDEYRYLPISYSFAYQYLSGKGMYYKIGNDLHEFSSEQSWVEWSTEHPDLAALFWPNYLYLLRNEKVDRSISIILLKILKAENFSLVTLQELIDLYIPKTQQPTAQLPNRSP